MRISASAAGAKRTGEEKLRMSSRPLKKRKLEQKKKLLDAADQGDSDAQYNLGVCYENGTGGLEKDEKEAVRLYRLAADQGRSRAIMSLRQRKRRL